MFHPRAVNGYTLIEILVVLVIVGLLASMTVPGLFGWLESRERALIKDELQSRLMQLPLKSRFTHTEIVINDAAQIEMSNMGVGITMPIQVLKNGYCLGGEVEVVQGAGVATYRVLPPYCELSG